MPRLVDHAARRLEIVEVTWRLLASEGPQAATMRTIADRAGFSNGVVGHYFTSKDDLIEAAYMHVYDQTNLRVRAVVADSTGLTALRKFCLEVAPVNELQLLEARVVLGFWPRAAADPRLAQISAETVKLWRRQMHKYVAEARRDGEIIAAMPDKSIVECLLAVLFGFQSLAVLHPKDDTPRVQVKAIDDYLQSLT
jgi:AcrR family transcriptional regulator